MRYRGHSRESGVCARVCSYRACAGLGWYGSVVSRSKSLVLGVQAGALRVQDGGEGVEAHAFSLGWHCPRLVTFLHLVGASRKGRK